MKFKLAAITLLFSAVASAESYNTIASLTHTDNDVVDFTGVGITHYFDAKETIGPLDQFSFINSHSLIGAGFVNGRFNNTTSVNGEWHSSAGLFLGGAYSYIDVDNEFVTPGSADGYAGTIGYQASEKWAISATFSDADNADSSVNFAAKYKHQLSGQDYLGFSYSTNDDTDFHSLGVKYFSALDNGQYLILDADYTDYDAGSEFWSIGGQWYFNEKTSLMASIGDEDEWEIGGQHFFNKYWAVSASYSENDLLDDGIWQASVRAQF